MRTIALIGLASSCALLHAAPTAAACVSWKVHSELSLRHVQGWTMLQLRQDGDRLSGSARRDGEASAAVVGRVQPQRIWLKVSWPGGAEIFDGVIGPGGEIRGTRIAQDGRQDTAAWEAIEPLQCIASSSASQGAPGGGPTATEPTLDEFTRAARDIIGILRGDNAQPATTSSVPATTPSAGAGSADPFGPAPAGGSDPFEQPPAGDGAGSADPFGSAPAGGTDPFEQAPTGGTDPFGPLPAESPPPSTPSDRPSRTLPPSALDERSIGSVTPKPATAKSMPIVLIPIGPITDTCASGFVWREARPSDHVCVPPPARDRVKGENHFARHARDPEAISLCKAGYVWRGAYDGDRTCVAPTGRDQAAEENRLGPLRKASN